MERYAWKATVLPGKLNEYIDRHSHIWPEMKQVLHDAGIRNYTIWNVGNELFGYYECDSVETAARVQAESAVVDKWNVYMQNHGLIVHDDDPDRCLAISRDANERLAAQFGLAADSFPEVRVRARADGLFEADTPFLRDALRSGRYTCRQLLDEPLYPDQIVFLNGTFFMWMPSAMMTASLLPCIGL